ncbi:hypothetical protein VPH35_097747 [Triticum aestivum]
MPRLGPIRSDSLLAYSFRPYSSLFVAQEKLGAFTMAANIHLRVHLAPLLAVQYSSLMMCLLIPNSWILASYPFNLFMYQIQGAITSHILICHLLFPSQV